MGVVAIKTKKKMSNKYKHGKYRISIADDKNIQNKVVSITDDKGNNALDGGSISDLIPEAASADNQLADKEYVDNNISTASATFRGTSAKDLTEQQFLAWANSLTKDKNDYVFWDTVDTKGNEIFKRYKWDGTQWSYEYSIFDAEDETTEMSEVIAETFAYLNDRVDALYKMVLGEGDGNTPDFPLSLKPYSVDAKNIRCVGVPTILYCSQAGAPAAARIPDNWDSETMGQWTGVPMFIGQLFVDMTTPKLYCAKALTAATSDWFAV